MLGVLRASHSAEEGAGTGDGSTCGWGGDHLTAAQLHWNKAGQDEVEKVGSSRLRWSLALRRPI